MKNEDFYPVQVCLPSGGTKTLLSNRDLIEAVEETGGEEMSGLVQDIFTSLEEEKTSLQEEIEEYRRDFEVEQEERTRILFDLREEAEHVQKLLEAARLNRKKIIEHLDAALRIIDAET